MELSKRDKTIKYVVYILVLLAAALLQNVSGLFPSIFGARCFLLIPTAVLLGLGEEEKTAALLGLLAGVVWDAVSAQHGGFNAIFLMLVCYFGAALVNFIFRNTFWFGVLCAGLAALAYVLLYWLLFVLIRSPQGAGRVLGSFYLPCFAYTAVLTPLLQLLLSLLKAGLNKAKQLEL